MVRLRASVSSSKCQLYIGEQVRATLIPAIKQGCASHAARLLILAVAVITIACGRAAAEQISLAAKAWDIRFSHDMPKRPYTEGSDWVFDFPKGTNYSVKGGCPGVHHVTTKYTKSIPADLILIISFKVEADSSTVFNFKLRQHLR